MGLALYEAVVGGMPENRSIARQLNGIGALPETNGRRRELSDELPYVVRAGDWPKRLGAHRRRSDRAADILGINGKNVRALQRAAV